jgi:hypothetical protein
MNRMGCYTGFFYSVDVYRDGVDECCILISDKVKNDPVQMHHLKEQLARRCEKCNGCPAARRRSRSCCGSI